MTDIVSDLEAEQHTLLGLVASIGADDWLRPTPARGWDVRDTISHLAHTDEIAVDTITGGLRSLNVEAARYASGEDFTLAGCLLGRRMAGDEVRAWWERAQAHERDVLLACDPGQRVPWGIGMSARSLATARLMETWAHGLDVFAALGVEPVDTDRLRHVAWLGYRALPYAFGVAGREAPDAPLRVELTAPSGEEWVFGPPGAADVVRGPAGVFCRLFVQRIGLADAGALVAQGVGARAALEVARAFL